MNTPELLELLSTPSPTGWENPGQECWSRMVTPYSDRVESDAYGNTWAMLEGRGGPTVMIEAHADEIGFVIRHVDDKGFLSIGPLGGSDRTLAAARRITIFGSKGPVEGIVGHTAIHLRDKAKDKLPEWKDLFVDVGAASAAEVAELGIRVGHPAIYSAEPSEFGRGLLSGRALDNRVGGWVLRGILEALSTGERPQATTIAVNAVQEEIGSHGARMMAVRHKPAAAIVFDVTHATDTPGIDCREHGLVKLGGGPTLSHGAANHPGIVAQLEAVATALGIPVQHEAVSRSTSTDADVIYIANQGIPTALVSIPLRYMHSPTEVVSLDDLRYTVKLVAAFIAQFSNSSVSPTR